MESNFGDKTLAQLRQECRRRGAKTTGRKAELIERLEAYDRNADFGASENQCETREFRMELPHVDLFRDVNDDSQLPSVSMEAVKQYLEVTESKWGRIDALYESQHLLFLRHAPGSAEVATFIRAKVKASMKKSVSYFVALSLEHHGLPHQSECECAVGMGPHAICKHVGVVLLALTRRSEGSSIVCEQTCTERLQTFHVPKKQHTGSPVKATSFELSVKHKEELLKDPRLLGPSNEAAYTMEFRNRWFQSTFAPTSNWFQMFPPANIRATVLDHSYSPCREDEQFLRRQGITAITAAEVLSIEAKTRGQSLSKEWLAQREMRITSSNFGPICKAKNLSQHATNLMSTRDLSGVPAIRHGKKYEPAAASRLEEALSAKALPCGLFVLQKHPFLASSPDRVMEIGGERVVIEIKCPYSARSQKISPQTVPYLYVNGAELALKETHDYYYQVQGQLLCTGLSRCIFAVFTLEDFKYFTIFKNDKFIEKMYADLVSFFDVYFKPAILEKYYYKVY